MALRESVNINKLVAITSTVLSAGGLAPSMSAVIQTQSQFAPASEPVLFGSADEVGSYFGVGSDEYLVANRYFLGFVNSDIKPTSLAFSRFVTSPSPATLFGGNIKSMTLAQLKTVNDPLTLTFNGTSTTAAVDLTAATSFSNAASIILTAFSAVVDTVTYDTAGNRFIITGLTAGALTTCNFATGAAADKLKLSVGSLGAVASNGFDADTPLTAMTRLVEKHRAWATFLTLWEPSDLDKELYGEWFAVNSDRLYFRWDTTISAVPSDTVLKLYNRVDDAAFWAGMVASIAFTRTRGAIAFAYKQSPNLQPTVTNNIDYSTLLAAGYNFYGRFSTNTEQFTFAQSGQLEGAWKWLDPKVHDIYLAQQMQTALVNMFLNVKRVPYSPYGYGLIRAALMDVILPFRDFGGIEPGVVLSELQKAIIAGTVAADVSAELQTQGFYLHVGEASPQARTARTFDNIILFRMDGGSIRQINMTATTVL